MKVSELIERLEQFKAKHGDAEVTVSDQGGRKEPEIVMFMRKGSLTTKAHAEWMVHQGNSEY